MLICTCECFASIRCYLSLLSCPWVGQDCCDFFCLRTVCNKEPCLNLSVRNFAPSYLVFSCPWIGQDCLSESTLNILRLCFNRALVPAKASTKAPLITLRWRHCARISCWRYLLVPGLVKSVLPAGTPLLWPNSTKAFFFGWVLLFVLNGVPGGRVLAGRGDPRSRAMELMVIQQSLALVAALAVAQCLALLCVSQRALAAAKSAHMVFAALRRCLLISASRSQLTMGPKVSPSLFQCEVIVMLIALWDKSLGL